MSTHDYGICFACGVNLQEEDYVHGRCRSCREQGRHASKKIMRGLERKVEESDRIARSRAEGARGALGLYLIGLTFIGPLFSLIFLVALLADIQTGRVNIATINPSVLVIVTAQAVISLGLTAFGVYVGAKLWRLSPNAPKVGKIYSLFGLGFALGDLIVDNIMQTSDPFLGPRVAFFLGLYAVLRWSKRVKELWPERSPG